VKDDEDLELAALERKLDDAFQTTRPRADFEDELWLRMQSKRPLWQRLRDLVGGLGDSARQTPGIPAAAVATIVIVALVGSIYLTSNWPTGGGATSATLGGARNSEDGAAQTAGGAFGRLPAPGLQPSTAPTFGGGPKVTGPEDLSGATAYYGPANLTFSGKLDTSLASAPVFRYAEPQASDAAGFGQAVGAATAGGPVAAPYIGSYSSRDFTLAVRGTTRSPNSEPAYLLTVSAPASSSSNDPVQVAKNFLQAHNLTPGWPYVVATEQTGAVTHVLYLRQFDVPGQGNVDVVDGTGAQYGMQIEVQGSRVLSVAGPLPLPLDSALYPLISADQAVRIVLASNPAGAQDTADVPAVTLTSARLVYALAFDGSHGYYEPAFLFSGTFSMKGQTYVKRVLIPALPGSVLSS
jgi:hypothetical protein